MEKEILFISLLTLVYLYDFTILNQDLSYPCTIRNKLGKVKLSFVRHSKDISGLIPFSLYLKNNISGKIDNASCYIYIKDFKIFNFNLFQQSAYAYCYFLSDILDDINNYKISSVKSKYDIKVNDNFKFNVSNKDEYSSHNMSIFYRKVDNFEFVSKKGTFMFYGQKKLLSKSLDSITFIIKLYYENYNEIREAKCSRKKIEDITLYVQQISYKCEIAEMNKNFKNLRILDSDYVSDIPYDYNNMNKDPIETQKATKARNLDSNRLYFNIHNIYCNNRRDIFIFNGTISGLIKKSKEFSIFPSSSDKDKCYVPAANISENIQIKCLLYSTISQKNNLIVEKLKKDNVEILFDNNLKTNNECTEVDSILYFRQINSFKYKNKNIIEFNFIGMTSQPIYIENNIYLYLYLINKNEKLDENLREANCSLNNDIQIKNFIQGNYICEIKIKNIAKDYSSFILSSYNNTIKDIPEDKTLLNPVETDKAIKKARPRASLIASPPSCGAVKDLSPPPYFPNGVLAALTITASFIFLPSFLCVLLSYPFLPSMHPRYITFPCCPGCFMFTIVSLGLDIHNTFFLCYGKAAPGRDRSSTSLVIILFWMCIRFLSLMLRSFL